MPYGRGGAGNFEAATQAQKKADDVEAQRPQEQPQPSVPANPTPANAAQEYAHMGRGGSGNWYSPKDLSQTGTFQATSETVSRAEKEAAASEPRKVGRGGAGNLIWDEENASQQQKQAMEIELKDMVARDVEAGLPRPDRVFMRPENE